MSAPEPVDVRLAGGQALTLNFAAGDRFRLAPQAGSASPCALVWVFGPDGKAAPDALEWGRKGRSRTADIALGREAFASELAGHLDLSSAPVASVAGRETEVAVLRDCVVALAVPLREDPARVRAAGEVLLRLHRAVPEGAARPPPPLADPLQDFLLERRTGRAYEVSAGDYVQIVDIAGKQCSDFLAFPRDALDAGRERFIDTAVTRSMTAAAATPSPGLCDRFFDQDIRPLMRTVRDTCGRHDTFGIACAALTYERKGYFDHPNCSDNISAVMARWGVAPRKAWPAINFFYNTCVESGVLAGGEGWSRPGDYVLLQALTDLVCVSTACPDETTPINGWDPTDVQIRVYPKTADFSRASAFRMRPESPPTLTRETGFHLRLAPLVRNFIPAKEFWIAKNFTRHTPEEEYRACRERATMQDLSHLRKFEITGPDAECLMDYTLTRRVARIAPGAAAYSPMCRAHGAMFDDGILMRLSADGFRWLCADPRAGEWLERAAAAKNLNVHVRDVSVRLCNLAIQGPKSGEIVETVIAPLRGQQAVAELARFRFLIGRLSVGGGEGPVVLLSRTGYTGGLGYEIFCAPNDAPQVWDAAQAAGTPLGLLPMGLDALEMLRIEAGLPAGGHEFGGAEDVDPFEAGAGFAVHADKPDFIGKAAMVQAAAAPRRVLAGLVLDAMETPAPGAPVFADAMTRVGAVTSAVRLPGSAGAVALARLAAEACAPGTRLEIGMLDGFQKRLGATVSTLPFHRPEGGPRRNTESEGG